MFSQKYLKRGHQETYGENEVRPSPVRSAIIPRMWSVFAHGGRKLTTHTSHTRATDLDSQVTLGPPVPWNKIDGIIGAPVDSIVTRGTEMTELVSRAQML